MGKGKDVRAMSFQRMRLSFKGLVQSSLSRLNVPD
jgi:hypothetical protein